MIRDKSNSYFKFKRSEPFGNDRFKAKKESLFKDFHHDKNSDECENPSQSLLQEEDDRNGFNGFSAKKDLREKHELPPRWVDQEEQVEENIGEIKKQLSILETEIKKIKHHTYMNNENIPVETIERTNAEIVDLIRRSEVELKEIMSFKLDNDVDNEIRKNVHYSLAIKLRELTQKTKQKEKEFLTIIRSHYHKDEDDLENGVDFDDYDDDEGQMKMKEQQRIQEARSKEIEEVVAATNELAALFKELSVLVIEQGTILDRIDYNIEESLQHAKKGKKHLVEAKKASESTRARNILM